MGNKISPFGQVQRTNDSVSLCFLSPQVLALHCSEGTLHKLSYVHISKKTMKQESYAKKPLKNHEHHHNTFSPATQVLCTVIASENQGNIIWDGA